MTTSDDARPWQDESVLREMYVEKRMTTYEIADEFGCSDQTISKWLRKHDIQTRTRGDYMSGRGNSRWQEWALFVHADICGYERWTSNYDEAAVLVHRLAAVAWYGWDAVEDNVVHHKDNIPWHNVEDNLVPLSTEEHGRLHAYEKPQASDGKWL